MRPEVSSWSGVPVVVCGAGRVGRKHAEVLRRLGARVALADPAQHAHADEHDPHQAMRRFRPDLVVVATPPDHLLPLARVAARRGIPVLVEKPVATGPCTIEPEDERIYVACETHVAPTAAWLLSRRPTFHRATINLTCYRAPTFYRGWRSRPGNGLLHHPALQSVTLACRLLSDQPASRCVTTVSHGRGLPVEDQIDSTVAFPNGRGLEVRARVDVPGGGPEHTMRLSGPDGSWLLAGRDLTVGIGQHPEYQGELRARLYSALAAALDMDTEGAGSAGLLPLPEYQRVLNTIAAMYRATNTTEERQERVP